MMTDKQVDEMVQKLRGAFGVETADDLVSKMVDRFLSWKLPEDFYPDAGISFERTVNGQDRTALGPAWWPSGTNLFHAEQARAMILHMLGQGDD